MSYEIIAPNGNNHQVISIGKTEHDVPYLEIGFFDWDGEEQEEFLVSHVDVSRCGENLIWFYPTDEDEGYWLVGESVELDNVMREVDLIYMKEANREGNQAQ